MSSITPWLFLVSSVCHYSCMSLWGLKNYYFFLGSANSILKPDHGFLAVATGIFPNGEFLGLSTEKLSCVCGEEQCEGGSLLWGCFSCSSLAGVQGTKASVIGNGVVGTILRQTDPVEETFAAENVALHVLWPLK